MLASYHGRKNMLRWSPFELLTGGPSGGSSEGAGILMEKGADMNAVNSVRRGKGLRGGTEET